MVNWLVKMEFWLFFFFGKVESELRAGYAMFGSEHKDGLIVKANSEL